MDRVALKEFLQKKYESPEAFLKNVIFPVFGEDNYDDSGSYHWLRKHPEDQTAADNSGILDILVLGSIYVEGSQLDVFDITVASKRQLANSRVGIQQLIRRIISTHSGAFMIFHYNTTERWDWRFTFCHKGASQLDSSDAKRYTFLLGPGQSCRTAAENFCKLGEKIATDGSFEMDDIIKAFDVEALSKEFFEKYKVHYGRFVAHVIGKEYVDRGEGKGEWRDGEGLPPSELFYGLGSDEKLARDYVKKLLGRIVFLHFLQKKGWLGATDENWTNGPEDFMTQLFDRSSPEQKDNFLDEILEPLFSCLDTPLTQRREVFDTKVDGLRSARVPFLGGLFERTSEDKARSVFPTELFADLFRFLSEYNFTIDENDPNDAQVGVDPEMLGRIFENLLEDNKDKGAFYTPKEIVQYMCRESLIAYLQTGVTDQGTLEALRQFVTTHDVALLGGKESALACSVSQRLKDVKICDPAIGSGAFPMGLLNELFLCRGVIEDFSNAAEIKRHIIQQNIYGVDIEKGAVEIARLRFWLSLITDADKPDVLPNMDFKIMQGNSLLEQFEGIDLSHICEQKTDETIAPPQRNLFGDIEDKQLTITFSDTSLSANLQNNMAQFFSATDPDEKVRLRNQVGEIVRELIELNINGRHNHAKMVIENLTTGECKTANQFRLLEQAKSDLKRYNDALERIASLPMQNSDFFLWHTWFADVFDKGGFDIVIANPPYIKEDFNSKAFEGFKEHSTYYMGKMDLWYGFACYGFDILKAKGHLCFIAQNNWTTNAGAKKLRNKILCDSRICQLIDFDNYMVFEDSASIQTMIMLFEKNVCDEYTFDFRKLNCNHPTKEDAISMLDKKDNSKYTTLSPLIVSGLLKDKLLSFVSDSKDALLIKIAKNASYLTNDEATNGIHPHFDFVNNKIHNKFPYMSVGAGIFGLSDKELEHLNLSVNEKQLIKPYYTSEQTLRYYTFEKNQLWIIYTDSSFKERSKMLCYPNIKAHLDYYKDAITSDNRPYGLHRAREEKFFKGEKIASLRMCSDRQCFSYSDFDCYLSAAFYIIKTERFNMKFLTGLFNSRLMGFWLKNRGKVKGEVLQIDKEPIMMLPIKVNGVDDIRIEEIVNDIITIKKQNPQADTTALEHEIDLLVYDLYGLDAEEIAIIEAADKQ